MEESLITTLPSPPLSPESLTFNVFRDPDPASIFRVPTILSSEPVLADAFEETLMVSFPPPVFRFVVAMVPFTLKVSAPEPNEISSVSIPEYCIPPPPIPRPVMAFWVKLPVLAVLSPVSSIKSWSSPLPPMTVSGPWKVSIFPLLLPAGVALLPAIILSLPSPTLIVVGVAAVILVRLTVSLLLPVVINTALP